MLFVRSLKNQGGSVMPRQLSRAAEPLLLVGRTGQVAPRSVRIGHPFLEGCRRLEEHMRKLRPRHRSEQNGRRKDVKTETEASPREASCLHEGPDQTQCDAGEQRQ